ncbi:MAG: 2,5-diketo-D-gluconate reductase [Pseudonocardiales bacterium]|jgi:diketogulonate reductase-like aldo/keto reductase|nr:2,5-diketo-D-gluconate reductase [Pseudonocardiales bacterium]
MTNQPTVTLNTGDRMPQLGFGVFQVPLAETQAAVTAALQAGYRSIDTAAMYRNEQGVGAALAAADVGREEIFLTTKLNNNAHGYDQALAAFEASRLALGVDYVDLYLIHWPLPARDRYVETWEALLSLQADGRVRAAGVSNFQPAHLRRLVDETGGTPALNQVELHPYLVQQELRDLHAELGIVTEAWSPLAKGGRLLTDPLITGLAEKYGKTPAQIVIRWHLQLGNVVIPKSVTPSRIAENIDVFDVELAPDDVAAITALNRDERTGPDPDTNT